MARILIVDDDTDVHTLIGALVKGLGHEADFAEFGISALVKLKDCPPDLVFMDIQMPGLSGLETLEKIKADSANNAIPIIMVFGYDDSATVLRCLELGADDFILKPCDMATMRARLTGCLREKRIRDLEVEFQKQVEHHSADLEARVAEQVRSISQSQLATIFALSKLAESRDPDTGEHLERIREYCKLLCIQRQKQPGLGHDVDDAFVNDIYAASPLHDIGKVGIPDRVLLKEKKLTEEEFEVIKTHTTIGADTLRAVDGEFGDNEFIRLGIEIAECHHEKWDGSGYPNGLSGEDIPLSARILALADAYDALTSKRCYKKAFDHEKSRTIILEGRGSHFDPDIVDAFLAVEHEFQKVRRDFDDTEISRARVNTD